jgi:hypothetical protein
MVINSTNLNFNSKMIRTNEIREIQKNRHFEKTMIYSWSPKVVTPDTTFSRTLRTSAAHFTGSSMPPKTELIPHKVLEPALHFSGMTAQDVRTVLRNSEWQALASSNNQVVFLLELTETETATPLSTDDIATIFNIQANHVRQIRYRAA